MKKRLLVLLLVVALAVTVSVFTATANTELDFTTDFEFVAGHCPVHGDVTWTEISGSKAGTEIAAGGHYVLTGPVTLTSTIELASGTTCIHLNGNTMTSTGIVLTLTGGTLNIMDNNAAAGYVQGAVVSNKNAPFQVAADANLNIYNAKLQNVSTATGNQKTSGCYPGGLVSNLGGNVAMYGKATLSGGRGHWGGNVYMTGGTFVMNEGCSIVGGIGSSGANGCQGGNVYLTGGTFTMNGGAISGGFVESQKAAPQGGNVYIGTSATFELLGGTISNGTTQRKDGYTGTFYPTGGNVYVGGTFTTSSNASISGGHADHMGGSVYAAKSFTLNCEVSGGTSANGGNLGIAGNVTVTVKSTITGGDATSQGGNVHMSANGNLLLEDGGAIINGYSKSGPGGISATSTADITMVGGEISGNRTGATDSPKSHGSNLLLNNAGTTLTISGGTIAGGVCLNNGVVNASGSAVIKGAELKAVDAEEGKDNNKVAVAPGIHLLNGKKITLNGALNDDFSIQVNNDVAICDIPDGKTAEDMKAYFCGRYVWGSALYDNNGVLTIGSTDVHIVAKDKAFSEANINNFYSIEEALAVIDPETEMIYMKNVDSGSNTDDRRTYADPIVIDKDVTIDLNGVAINGTFAVAEGKTLTLVDVTADDDLVNGPTSFVTVDGNVAKQSVHPYWGVNYVVLQDADGVAVPHSVSMKVNKAYILEGEKGLYYGVEYKMDPTLAAEVDQFGQFIYVNENAQYYTLEEDFMGYYANGAAESTGVKITGIVSGAASDAANAGTDIYAYGYISFNNGETIKDTAVCYTMTEIMELAAEQEKADLQDFYDTYAATTGWDVNENMTYFQGTAE